jgi:hypothetical protein
VKWTGAGPTRSDGKSLEDGGAVESTVEEVLDLGEISIGVLLEAEGVVGAGLSASWSAAMPVIPKRPRPDLAAAMGWVQDDRGRHTLFVPRVEMGQNILTALKQC